MSLTLGSLRSNPFRILGIRVSRNDLAGARMRHHWSSVDTTAVPGQHPRSATVSAVTALDQVASHRASDRSALIIPSQDGLFTQHGIAEMSPVRSTRHKERAF